VSGLSVQWIVFTRDHLFASPSMAAVAVMGRSANGWLEWKSPQGKTLDEVKRQSVRVRVELWETGVPGR
jgi:hypothetical protein